MIKRNQFLSVFHGVAQIFWSEVYQIQHDIVDYNCRYLFWLMEIQVMRMICMLLFTFSSFIFPVKFKILHCGGTIKNTKTVAQRGEG